MASEDARRAAEIARTTNEELKAVLTQILAELRERDVRRP
jgi:hypothetical protein